MIPNPQDVHNMRQQGLTDSIISKELQSKGHSPEEVNMAMQDTQSGMIPPNNFGGNPMNMNSSSRGSQSQDMYERVEEIVETMIDEKWNELIQEVKKVLEWKSKVEQRQTKIETQLTKLEDDFKTLHHGILGKLEDYDSKMKDVGTELKAVGKVFKDVIPTFVDNVKELKGVTEKIRKK